MYTCQHSVRIARAMSMFTRLGTFTVRRRKGVLAASVLVLLLAGVLGSSVLSHLSGGGFDNPSSDSTRAERALEDTFGTGSPNYILLVDANHGAPLAADGSGTPAVDAGDVSAAATAA